MSDNDNNKKPPITSAGEIIYSTHYYDVILLDEPIVLQPTYELATYGIFNKMTGIIEIEMCVFPAAINTADNFNEALEVFFPPSSMKDKLSIVKTKDTFAEDLTEAFTKVWEDDKEEEGEDSEEGGADEGPQLH